MSDPANTFPNLAHMTSVLGETARILEDRRLAYVTIGSVAGNLLGDTRWPSIGSDLDIFVRESEAREVVKALCAHGFYELWSNEDWLWKARKDGVLVDVIFRAAGDMRLDDQALSRAARRTLNDATFWLIPPEDYIVMQVVTHGPQTPQHWFHALGVVTRSPIDWEYLRRRANGRGDRLTAFLLYARSEGVHIPQEQIEAMLDSESVRHG